VVKNCNIRHGTTARNHSSSACCVGFEESDDRRRSIFQNGKDPLDLLIGADGTNSVVRQGIIGDGFQPCRASCLAQARSIFSRAIAPTRKGPLAHSRVPLMDGDGYTFGVQGVSADDYVNRRATDANSRFEDICRVGRFSVGAITQPHPQQIL